MQQKLPSHKSVEKPHFLEGVIFIIAIDFIPLINGKDDMRPGRYISRVRFIEILISPG